MKILYWGYHENYKFSESIISQKLTPDFEPKKIQLSNLMFCHFRQENLNISELGIGYFIQSIPKIFRRIQICNNIQ